MNCPKCGTGNGPGAQYCGACGKRLPEARAAAPPAPRPPKAPAFDRPAPPSPSAAFPAAQKTNPDLLTGLFLFWAYKAGFEWSRKQGTFGKQRWGLKVVTVHGGPLSLRVASIRCLAWIFSTVMLGLGHAVALFTPGRRALHDLFADTVVVRAHDPDTP